MMMASSNASTTGVEAVAAASDGGGGGGGRGGARDDDDGGDDERFDDGGRHRTIVTCAALAFAMTFAHAGDAYAKQSKGEATTTTTTRRVDEMEFATIVAREFGISGIVGLGAGLAVRALAMNACVVFASVVAFLRWLEMNDVVDVKWQKARELARRGANVFDVNRDGVVDGRDANALKEKVVNFYSACVPSAAGVGAGFLFGLRLG